MQRTLCHYCKTNRFHGNIFWWSFTKYFTNNCKSQFVIYFSLEPFSDVHCTREHLKRSLHTTTFTLHCNGGNYHYTTYSEGRKIEIYRFHLFLVWSLNGKLEFLKPSLIEISFNSSQHNSDTPLPLWTNNISKQFFGDLLNEIFPW